MTKNHIAARWLVGTLGLVLIAFGVALSLKSNLGTAPPSCPPAVLNLQWGAISFGTFTWMMHLLFIAAQMAMRRKVLDVHYLVQLAAAFVFGYLCDGCIWLLKDVEITSYLLKIVLIFRRKTDMPILPEACRPASTWLNIDNILPVAVAVSIAANSRSVPQAAYDVLIAHGDLNDVVISFRGNTKKRDQKRKPGQKQCR